MRRAWCIAVAILIAAIMWFASGFFELMFGDGQTWDIRINPTAVVIIHWRCPDEPPDMRYTRGVETSLFWYEFPALVIHSFSRPREFGVLIPLWPLWLIAAVLVGLRFATRRPPPGHCPQCGYNLRGNTSGVCPECGCRRSEAERSTPPR